MKIFLVIWYGCDSGYKVLGAYRNEKDAIEASSHDHRREYRNGHFYTYKVEDIDIEEVELQ